MIAFAFHTAAQQRAASTIPPNNSGTVLAARATINGSVSIASSGAILEAHRSTNTYNRRDDGERRGGGVQEQLRGYRQQMACWFNSGQSERRAISGDGSRGPRDR